MRIKRRFVSVSLALSISAASPSARAICLSALHRFAGSFHLFHGRWIYTDIHVLYCRWNFSYLIDVQVLAYLECFQNVPSSVQAFLLLSKEYCRPFLLQGHRFKTTI